MDGRKEGARTTARVRGRTGVGALWVGSLPERIRVAPLPLLIAEPVEALRHTEHGTRKLSGPEVVRPRARPAREAIKEVLTHAIRGGARGGLRAISSRTRVRIELRIEPLAQAIGRPSQLLPQVVSSGPRDALVGVVIVWPLHRVRWRLVVRVLEVGVVGSRPRHVGARRPREAVAHRVLGARVPVSPHIVRPGAGAVVVEPYVCSQPERGFRGRPQRWVVIRMVCPGPRVVFVPVALHGWVCGWLVTYFFFLPLFQERSRSIPECWNQARVNCFQ